MPDQQLSLFALKPEAWELTLEEFALDCGFKRAALLSADRTLTPRGEEIRTQHASFIEEALNAQREVPPFVLADHRELAGRYGVALNSALRGIFDGPHESAQDQVYESLEPDAKRCSERVEPESFCQDGGRGDSGRLAELQIGTGGCQVRPVGRAGDRPVSSPRTRPRRNAPVLVDPTRNLANYRLASEAVAPTGLKAKFNANIQAIQNLKFIEEEERNEATDDEKAALARFVGWGHFPQVFAGTHEWKRESEELQTLLTAEEFEAARASTINAHYTTPAIARCMWTMAMRLGFRGGRVLEPSVGIGYFFGCIPESLSRRTLLTGVEMDSVSGRIARFLYPGATVHVQPFQDIPPLTSFYQLVIGNVPFGDITVRRDKRYARLKPSLHDYFVLRAVDEVQPGGLVVVITSRYTMDAEDQRVRAAIAAKAELVAAFRLPCTAFKSLAGTEVVADILVLRKRLSKEPVTDLNWIALAEVADPDGGDPIRINEFYANSPRNILGRLDRTGTMYGGTSVNVSPNGDLMRQLRRAVFTLPKNIVATSGESDAEGDSRRPVAPTDLKAGGYLIRDGRLYVAHHGELIQHEVSADAFSTIRDTLLVRDALRSVLSLEIEGQPPDEISNARGRLNTEYDRFVARHGFLNSQRNRRAFAEDPDSPAVLALEKWDPAKKIAYKADVFYINTVRSRTRAERAGTIAEAVAISLNEVGGIDTDRIAELLGRPVEEVERELVDKSLAFRDPTGGWLYGDFYRSGNVRARLIEARRAAGSDPVYLPNVAALELVQPEDLDVADIYVRLGAPWIPASDIRDFIVHLLGGDREDYYVKLLSTQGSWLVGYTNRGANLHKDKSAATEIWGTSRVNFMSILQSVLDGRPVVVYDPAENNKTVVNAEESAKANSKGADIAMEFANWLWTDDERRIRLHRYYNDTFNNMRRVKYDGRHLTFPGMNVAVTLRESQVNAVWRTIVNGSALYAHQVGLGKTYTMIGAAMEMRRLGLAKKPAIAALKTNIGQVVEAARYLYPGAQILTTLGNFTKDKRKKMVARIATGDYDLIILTHEHLDMLPMRPEAREAFVKAELEELQDCIDDYKGADSDRGDARAVKRLEKLKQNIEERLLDAIENSRKDDAVFFEETGIDFLFIDESHHYKSLPCYTKRDRVKGIPSSRSDRATNLWMRARWLQQRNGGRGLTFATGTCITNSLCELYILQRYLQSDELLERGVAAFDAWANVFGDLVTRMEYAVTGDFKAVTRFAKYVNIPELLQIAGQMMDVQFADGTIDIKRPERRDSVVSSPMSENQKRFLQSLKKRAERLKKVKPHEDNMLAISNDARKMSLDYRLIRRSATDPKDSKINKLVENVLSIHRERPEATQLIFCDLGVNPVPSGFWLYRDIIDKLVAGGIDRDLIIDFSKITDKAKEEAMRRLRSGEALIGLGSTGTLGTGVNIQDRCYAGHHVDAPWRPDAVEQRDGRIWRHGNMHYDLQVPVALYRYVTEGSFDTFVWQAVASKSAFIHQVLRGGVTERVWKDEDVEELSPAMVMAIASGNPDLLTKVNLDEQVRELQSRQRLHASSQYRLRNDAAVARPQIEQTTLLIQCLKNDAAHAAATTGRDFEMQVMGKLYYDQKSAGYALLAAARSVSFEIGEFRGFKIIRRNAWTVCLEREASYPINYREESGDSTVKSIIGILSKLGLRIDAAERNLTALETNLAKIDAELGRPFRDADKLKAKLVELAEVEARLESAGEAPEQSESKAA